MKIWNTLFSLDNARAIYHSGRTKELHKHSKVANLVHWYRLDAFGSLGVGSSLDTISIIEDSTPRGYKQNLAVSQGSNITISTGIPTNLITDSALRIALDAKISSATDFDASHSNGDFTITKKVIGTDTSATTADSNIFSSIVSPTSGGAAASGSSDGDTLTIADDTFTLDDDGGSGTHIIAINGVSDSTFWNALSQSIKNQTNFTEINIAGSGATRTFSLTASANGAINNVNLSETGESFTSVLNATGGVTEAGALDYDEFDHYMHFHAITFHVMTFYKLQFNSMKINDIQ